MRMTENKDLLQGFDLTQLWALVKKSVPSASGAGLGVALGQCASGQEGELDME